MAAEPIRDRDLRALAERKGWMARKQACPGTWVLWRQADEREGLDSFGDSAELVRTFLEGQPDRPGDIASTLARRRELGRARNAAVSGDE